MSLTPACAALLVLVVSAYAAATLAGDQPPLTERSAYREALDHLNAGRLEDFARIRDALDGYVLQPYLDYHALAHRIEQVPEAKMHAFRAAHPDLPVTASLYQRWLLALGRSEAWGVLARNPPVRGDAELDCYYLRALEAAHRERPPADRVGELWTVGRSQPEACNTLFEAWIRNGHLTADVAWQRLRLALAANQVSLARYLLRFFDAPQRDLARAYYEVHVQPPRVLNRAWFRDDSPWVREVLAHGLGRLAGTDPEAASVAWQDYSRTHAFSAGQVRAVAQAVLLGNARRGVFPEHLPAALTQDPPPGLRARMAQEAVNRQDWDAALAWIQQLSPDERAETRWRYWQARGLEADALGAAEAQTLYRALATERDYYGFLAAQRAGLPTRLNDAGSGRDEALMQELARDPAAQRAIELHAVGELELAAREWEMLLPRLDRSRQMQAAYLAQQAGWIPQSIQIANAAQLRDHIDLRFPVAYEDLFANVSRATRIDKPFLLAIARQESLFDPDARSSADARGVMQLLPSTARHVARLGALRAPAAPELHEPALNVELGGRHLARLLQRYGNHRALAAAAYNAGEGRVDRWVSGRTGEPVDVWIETIPFPETRNYVKNVLAFAQVYGHRLSAPGPMLFTHEAQLP
jgi:soluble lytic murein transglycosylase